jgi:hypothetical protein
VNTLVAATPIRRFAISRGQPESVFAMLNRSHVERGVNIG